MLLEAVIALRLEVLGVAAAADMKAIAKPERHEKDHCGGCTRKGRRVKSPRSDDHEHWRTYRQYRRQSFRRSRQCVPLDIFGARGNHDINACNWIDRWEIFNRESGPLTGDSGLSWAVFVGDSPFS
jgi:hypothetical protein